MLSYDLIDEVPFFLREFDRFNTDRTDLLPIL